MNALFTTQFPKAYLYCNEHQCYETVYRVNLPLARIELAFIYLVIVSRFLYISCDNLNEAVYFIININVCKKKMYMYNTEVRFSNLYKIVISKECSHQVERYDIQLNFVGAFKCNNF